MGAGVLRLISSCGNAEFVEEVGVQGSFDGSRYAEEELARGLVVRGHSEGRGGRASECSEVQIVLDDIEPKLFYRECALLQLQQEGVFRY